MLHVPTKIREMLDFLEQRYSVEWHSLYRHCGVHRIAAAMVCLPELHFASGHASAADMTQVTAHSCTTAFSEGTRTTAAVPALSSSAPNDHAFALLLSAVSIQHTARSRSLCKFRIIVSSVIVCPTPLQTESFLLHKECRPKAFYSIRDADYKLPTAQGMQQVTGAYRLASTAAWCWGRCSAACTLPKWRCRSHQT